MAKYRDPDPIKVSCESCGCLYTLIQAWKEPAITQSLKCKQCGHIVWSNQAGHRMNSFTGQKYTVSGEYQGILIPGSKPPDSLREGCQHEYQKERIMGAHTGDWVCTKCGDVTSKRPDRK